MGILVFIMQENLKFLEYSVFTCFRSRKSVIKHKKVGHTCRHVPPPKKKKNAKRRLMLMACKSYICVHSTL